MCKDSENTDVTASDNAPKARKLPQAMEQYKFTVETAKEAAKRAAYCRSLRAQTRKKMLEAAVDAGVDKIYLKALKSGDLDSITVVEKAMRLVGLDFASSEEAVQRTETKVDSKVKSDTKLEITVTGV